MTKRLILYSILILFGLRSHAQTSAVGTTEGVFNVSDLGAATYTIPVDAPKGVNGMEPSLSLSYSSLSGNGLMGPGWNINAGSVISRVPKDIYHDKKVAGISVTNDDVFTIDGNRLILIEGTYGALNSKYRTESESFRDIRITAASGNVPTSFTVTDLNGLTYRYGATANSRAMITGNPAPYLWLLTTVTDLNGNFTSYEYMNTPGEEVVLSYINYGGNVNTNAEAIFRIVFNYETRPDANFSYVCGSKISSLRRLQSIKTQRLSGSVWYVNRSYNMDYAADASSHLLKVTEKGFETNEVAEQLPPTEFTYGSLSPAYSTLNVSAAGVNTTLYEFSPGDYNGDGKADLIQYTRNYDANANNWVLYTSNGNGFTQTQTGALPLFQGGKQNRGAPRNYVASFFDYNGDGKDDFFYKTTSPVPGYPEGSDDNESYSILVSNGNGLSPLYPRLLPGNANGEVTNRCFKNSYPLIGDFDGDGKSEILSIRKFENGMTSIIGEAYVRPCTGSFNCGPGVVVSKPLEDAPFFASYCWEEFSCNIADQPKLITIDYNGDGRNEVLFINQGTASVYELNVTFDQDNKPVIGSPSFKLVNSSGYPTIWHKNLQVGDFNGDGITDVVSYAPEAGWEIGYGKGNGSMDDKKPFSDLNNLMLASNGNAAVSPLIVADFNGDRKTDVYFYPRPQIGSGGNPTILYSNGNNTFWSESLAPINSKVGLEVANYWPADYNGDGQTDLVTKYPGNWPYYQVSFHANENAHLLSKIKNGLSAETKISYLPLTNSGVYSPGNNVYLYPYIKRTIALKVVATVNTDNAKGTTGNNISYTYSGIKFNAHGKGLLGFDQTVVYHAVLNTTEEKTFGLNTNYALPYLQSTTVRQGSTMLSSAGFTNNVYDYGNKHIFPYVSSSIQTDYLKNTSVREDYSYTSPAPGVQPDGFLFGKPNTIVTRNGYSSEVIPGQANELEKTEQKFSFVPSLVNPYPPAYISSKAIGMVTTSTRNGQPPYSRTQTFKYDPTTALLQETKTDPGTANEVVASFVYDSYGNIIEKSNAASGLPSRKEIFEYDPTHRFVSLSYNAATPLVKTTKAYDNFTDNILSVTAPDGYKQTFTYDGFGRETGVIDNNGKSSTRVMQWASGNALAISTSQYFIKEISNTTAPSYSFYDRLGRLVRSVKTGFNGQMIFVDDVYDNKGLLVRHSNPYFQGTALSNNSFGYDSYGRMTNHNKVGSGNTTFTYTMQSGILVTTTTNPAGQVKKSFTDKSGKLVKTEDEGGTLEYVYHSNGNMKTTVLNGSATVKQTEYDDYGRLTKETDPNYGSYQYTYNTYGELLSKKYPKGTTYNYSYEPYGALKTKTGPEGTYSYQYNIGEGVNSGKMIQLAGPEGTHNYSYGLGYKVNYEERVMGSEMFKTEYTYDDKGRVNIQKFPNGKQIQFTYNSNDGSQATIGIPGATYFSPMGAMPAYLYEVTSKNVFGETTGFGQKSQAANVVSAPPYAFSSSQSYDAYGFLTEQYTYRPGTNMSAMIVLRKQQYGFAPATGNLNWRKDIVNNKQENFSFDNLNRLTNIQAQSTGANPTTFAPQQTSYDPNGNITQKTDAGTFTYDQANRVSEINPYVNIPATKQELTFTPFNMVSSITEGNHKATFAYWPDEERSRMQLYDNNNLKKTKYYAPDYEKEIDAATGVVRELCYVKNTEGNIVAILERKNGVDKTYYVLTDYLGSITHIINENGTIAEEKSFDAWGRARNPQTWAALPVAGESSGWDRGYTSHEHIPQFGIINMNGRLYDPVMGRMFSADPFINGTDNTQGYNRYTYAGNNPLLYTDPDGHVWHIVIGAIVGGVINLGIKAYQGKIHSFKDGAVAFGIGAVAGAVGAATGGAAFAMAGGGAAGAGGFLAGSVGGLVGSVTSQPIQSVGNTVYFGDAPMTAKEFAIGTLIATATGGLMNGTIGKLNGRDFLRGQELTPQVVPLQELPSVELQKSPISNDELVSEAAIRADRSVPSTGRPMVDGTRKHTFARDFLRRYQKMFGNRDLETNVRFDNIHGEGYGILDVKDVGNKVIYDFKFGKPVMSNAQAFMYIANHPEYQLKIVNAAGEQFIRIITPK